MISVWFEHKPGLGWTAGVGDGKHSAIGPPEASAKDALVTLVRHLAQALWLEEES